MTPEQINIAVAECLGWEWRAGYVIEFGATEARPIWFTPEGVGAKLGLPPFTTSLDACAEFEKTLIEFNECCEYAWQLELMFRELPLPAQWARPHNIGKFEDTIWSAKYFVITRATPLQRCESYLHLKGKWKETK